MITIEYIGETENGNPFSSCCGNVGNKKIKTTKVIYGKKWKVGKPQQVPISEFEKHMKTGLFKKS